MINFYIPRLNPLHYCASKNKRISLNPELDSGYKLFLDKIKLNYDSFARIVLNGYISSFHKAGNLTFYFEFILGHLYVNKKLLSSVTESYKKIIEDFAKKIYGPLHYSLFQYQVDSTMHTESKIEHMYRRLDDKIQDYLSGKDAA